VNKPENTSVMKALKKKNRVMTALLLVVFVLILPAMGIRALFETKADFTCKWCGLPLSGYHAICHRCGRTWRG
jgi:hypothetical protein